MKLIQQELFEATSPDEVEIVAKTDWLSLRRIVNPARGISGYDFSHEDRCDGIVSILPFRSKDLFTVEFLLREEVCPCWSSVTPKLCSITGGIDHGHTPRQTALIELREEAGYEIEDADLIDLGMSYGTKSCDTLYSLYAVNVTKKTQLAPTGDGSTLEKIARCVWTEEPLDSVDPFTAVAYARLVRAYKV